MGNIRQETREALENEIRKCSEHKMPYICSRISSKEGMDIIVNKVRNTLKSNPEFTLLNAIGHVEMELREIDLYS